MQVHKVKYEIIRIKSNTLFGNLSNSEMKLDAVCFLRKDATTGMQ